MSAIMKLRQARNAEQLAIEIEPLAQSLAALSDETRQILIEQQQASRTQALEWSTQQKTAAERMEQAAANIQEAAQYLKTQTETAAKVVNKLTLKLFLTAILSGALAAVLTSVFWLWLKLPEIKNLVNLDAQQVAEYLKPDLIATIRKRK